MPVSRLLKSCAMPPVSWPTASIFCAWRSASSAACSSAVRSSTRCSSMALMSTRAADTSFCSWMSVLVPIQRATSPVLSFDRHGARDVPAPRAVERA